MVITEVLAEIPGDEVQTIVQSDFAMLCISHDVITIAQQIFQPISAIPRLRPSPKAVSVLTDINSVAKCYYLIYTSTSRFKANESCQNDYKRI